MFKPNTGKLAQNSVLTEAEHEALIAQIRWPARKLLNARQYLPVRTVGADKWTATYWSAEDTSEATWSFNFSDPGEGVVEVTESKLKLPTLAKAFIATEQNDNPAYIQRNAMSAGMRVRQLENQMITEGLEFSAGSFAIKGLLNSANNSFTTACDFAGAGSQIEAIAGAIAALRVDSIFGPYFGALNTVQFGQYEKGWDTTSGLKSKEMVDTLLGGPGRVFLNPDLPAGSGMVWSRNPMYAELVVGRDLTEKSWEDRAKHFEVYEVARPFIYETNSICKLNDI